MTYKGCAISIKSRGGKGSRGVALFSHGPGEAVVHLRANVEDGFYLCGRSKKYKKSWTLLEKEVLRGYARRPSWRLPICSDCMTHVPEELPKARLK